MNFKFPTTCACEEGCELCVNVYSVSSRRIDPQDFDGHMKDNRHNGFKKKIKYRLYIFFKVQLRLGRFESLISSNYTYFGIFFFNMRIWNFFFFRIRLGLTPWRSIKARLITFSFSVFVLIFQFLRKKFVW